MTGTSSTTTVTIEIRDGKATINDVQAALDTLAREGIPGAFEITVRQWQDRNDSDREIPYGDRPVTHRMTIEASRAAK